MSFDKKNNFGNFFLTKHATSKMNFYGLSENRLKKIFRKPDRRQKGIASGTTALMQRVGGKRQTEIWLMYEEEKDGQKKIITAWRFPGISPVGEEIPIPKDILDEL